MIKSEDLAKLVVERTIFHDVPRHRKGQSREPPLLADAATTLDARRKSILRERLVRVMGTAYSVQFIEETTSPCQEAVRELTGSSADFIALSRSMALYLADLQTGSVSAGLLCLIDISCGSQRGVGILKLEREEGAQLRLSDTAKGKAFEMAVLDSLVLTEGTRLFKAALFLRRGKDRIDGAVCDGQRTTMGAADLARFWLTFLGCKPEEDPRVVTQRWYDTTLEFINERVPDPEEKSSFHDHLVSELRSNRTTITPRTFIDDYVPRRLQDDYQKFLVERGVGITRFPKDTSDFAAKLRRRSLSTAHGIHVSVPIDQEELLSIKESSIVIQDALQKFA